MEKMGDNNTEVMAPKGAEEATKESTVPRQPVNIDPHHGSDTTLKKLFIGGLAWQTTTERLKEHFAGYGELVEAVVILDKNTGRSKGYGFVTYASEEDAKKALKNTAPLIDGRRTNCNLAAFGNTNRRERSSKANHEGRQYGQGNRMQNGHYYYDQSMMYYGNMYQMENGGYNGNYNHMYPPMGSSMMGNFNPYMQFPMMMNPPQMMSSPHVFMMAPPGYNENMMYGNHDIGPS